MQTATTIKFRLF